MATEHEPEPLMVTLCLDENSTLILKRMGRAIRLLREVIKDQPWNGDVKKAHTHLTKTLFLMDLGVIHQKE